MGNRSIIVFEHFKEGDTMDYGDKHGHKNTLNKEHGYYANDGQAGQANQS